MRGATLNGSEGYWMLGRGSCHPFGVGTGVRKMAFVLLFSSKAPKKEECPPLAGA